MFCRSGISCDFSRRKGVCGQVGSGGFATVFWLFLFGCVFFACYKVIPFFYDAYELELFMQVQADRSELLSDDEIRKKLIGRIKELGIPLLDPSNLVIERYGDRVEIYASYDEVFFVDLGDYGDYDIYTFHFRPYAERKF